MGLRRFIVEKMCKECVWDGQGEKEREGEGRGTLRSFEDVGKCGRAKRERERMRSKQKEYV